MREICLPQFGMGMTEGMVTRWHRSVGDAIKEGEPLCDIETAKTTVEMQAPCSGTLATIVIPVDQSVPVNTCLALIDEGLGGAVSNTGVQPDNERAQSISAVPNPVAGPTVQIEPRAREAARIHQVELAKIKGSGPGSRILEEDVLAFVAQSAQKSAVAESGQRPGMDVPHSVVRRTTARRLTESKQSIPHYYLRGTCALDALLSVRQDFNAANPGSSGASINDFVLRAAALALRQVPDANVSWGEKSMRRHEAVDVALAVDTPQGVVTPIVRDADKKNMGMLSAETRSLISRARSASLQPEEYLGGSITISNLGMFGVEEFSAIINPPQAVIFAIGAAQQRPTVFDGQLVIATMMTCTLSVDHRAIDGAVAARLLSAFKSIVERPRQVLT
jgi:pyruvate dehydrogenase E2 component (dihydrolipoamide acetyltransferase)